MMGITTRSFAPVAHVTLDALVPGDHFYRHLDRTLDLTFVRELVKDCYAAGGRPSIDPVVFFRLQLILFFEGILSERQLLAHAADGLSVRWYLGYDLDEPLPDHSGLTRIRDRYGLNVFRRFFDTVVEQCQQADLAWGREFYLDATQVRANASLDSIVPRFRRFLGRRGIRNRIERKGTDTSERLGLHRWVVERTLGWLNQFLRLAIR